MWGRRASIVGRGAEKLSKLGQFCHDGASKEFMLRRLMGLGVGHWERRPWNPDASSHTEGSPLAALSREVFEAYATLQEVVLMPRDLQTVVPSLSAGDDVVVLIHGFMASPGVFRPLRHRLEQELLVKTASFTHLPGAGVEWIAGQLAQLLKRLPKGARVHLVGHSLGGFVARWYELRERHIDVVQTISLGSPFAGTKVAYGMPILVGADLHPRSPLVKQLRAKASQCAVPHLSIVGDTDRLVLPRNSAMLPFGDVEIVRGAGHNGLLYDERVHQIVCDRLLSYLKANKSA
jgi:triacylglycerol lipase